MSKRKNNKKNGKKSSIAGRIVKWVCSIIAIILVAVLLLLGVCAAVCEVAPGEKATEYTNPYITDEKALVSAHRSGKDIAPENTMMAFKNCIESEDFDVDIFEFDLHITKDNQLILLHDNTLDRTTNSVAVFGEADVIPSEKTYSELRQLNFGESFEDPDGNYPYRGLSGDEIPDDLRAVLLSDVLDYLESNGGFSYIIEIKDSDELGYKAADELYRVLNEKKLLDKVIVGTFNGEVTEYIDENYPDMLRSSGVKETVLFYFAAAFNMDLDEDFYKFEALQIPYNGYYVFNLSSERLINYAHRHNIAVQYWTVNNADDVEELNALGADCIMSDDPDMAYDVINN